MDEKYFATRRTVRRYDTSIQVPDSMLKDIIEQAAKAATTGNMQLYSVIITRDPEKKRELAPAHFGQPQVEGCAALLTFCADFHRFIRWCEVSGAEPGYDNFQSFMTAVLDTALFAQQFCTIAEMQGLGTCYLGTTTYNAPEIASILDLPQFVVPVTTLTVGWPSHENEDAGRLPVDAFLHKEVYHKPSDDDIKIIYSEKEKREDSKKFVAENNKTSLAQVFTDIRYPKANNEYYSKVYIDFIRKQGFNV